MQRGITGNEQHPADWERQREQLSAYLDGELAPADRAALETHLAACTACQAELEDLRALRALLRAMPAPALPRSFLLPEEGTVPQPISTHRAASPAAARSRGPGPHLAEWVGALVASLGLALLVGSALAGHGGPSASSALSPANSTGAQTTNSTSNATVPAVNQSHTPSAAYGDATTPASTPTAQTVTPAPTSSTTDRNGGGPATPADTIPPILPIGGAGLLIGGSVIFVAGRASAKRRPTA